MTWPTIDYKDESLREGMQIESAAIAVADKVRLLDALSDTGLKGSIQLQSPPLSARRFLIGDAFLYGGPPRGHVHARRPGHWATHEAIRIAFERGVLARV